MHFDQQKFKFISYNLQKAFLLARFNASHLLLRNRMVNASTYIHYATAHHKTYTFEYLNLRCFEPFAIDEWSRLTWMMCLCFIRMASASLFEFRIHFHSVVSSNANAMQFHVMNQCLCILEKRNSKENMHASAGWLQCSSFTFLNFRNPNTLFSFNFFLVGSFFFKCITFLYIFYSILFYVIPKKGRSTHYYGCCCWTVAIHEHVLNLV